jgi:hypothetical protein
MTQADSVLSTPPTNTPTDTTRRRFLAVAGAASAVSVTALAAAAMPVSASQCDAAVVAAGVQFEELFAKYVPSWLAWARLWRDAQAETVAKFGEDDVDNPAWHEPLTGTSPAYLFLMAEIEKNGCERASQANCDIFWQMAPFAEIIRESEVTSIAGLRAKTLVSVLDFWPGLAGHDGNLSFDSVESSHFSLFSAAVAVTGLSGFVGEIEKKLKFDAGASLRDGALVTA